MRTMTKLEQVRQHLAAGRLASALRICARFGELGEQKERITRGWAAYQNPSFYREIGQNPDALFADAIAAIHERYGITGGTE